MSDSGSIYVLRGPKAKVGREYCAEEEPETVKVNGIEVSVEEFRRMRPGKKQKMGIYRRWPIIS